VVSEPVIPPQPPLATTSNDRSESADETETETETEVETDGDERVCKIWCFSVLICGVYGVVFCLVIRQNVLTKMLDTNFQKMMPIKT